MPARVRSVGTAVSGTGGVTPGLPTYQQNDILRLWVRTANQPVAAPSGYTEKARYGSGTAGGTAAVGFQLFWKRASASESAQSVADSGSSTLAFIDAVAGCPTSGDPFDAVNGDVAATAATGVTIPGVTTTEDNALVTVAVANEFDSATSQTSGWSNATLKALIERGDPNTSSGNGGGIGLATARMPTAGATGTTSATLANASVQARIVCAMKSADGGDLYAGIQAVAAAVAGGAHKVAVTAGNSLMAGDSSTGDNMGSNAKNSAIAARVPLYLTGYAASNASFFGDGAANIAAGRTPHEYNSLVTLASGWSADDSQVSAGGAPYTSSGSGTSLSFAPGVTFDRIVPINARYAGGANYTVDIGGATLATLDMNGSPNAVIKHTPISCTSGVNTLYFDSTGAGGFIFGAYVYENASPKLHIINLGWAGSTTADWNNSADFKALQVLAALAPDILIFENGNDLLNGVSETTFKANVRAIVTPQLDRGAALLLMPPHYIDPGIISTPTQDAYSGWWYDLGHELGVPVYDVKTRPDRTSFAAADAAGFMAGDGIHGTGLGYDDQAQGLAEVIDYTSAPANTDLSLDAATTPAGAIVRSAGKAVAAQSTPAASTGRALGRSLTISASVASALAAVLAYARSLSAASDATASVSRSTTKTIASNGTATATIIKALSRTISAATEPLVGLLRANVLGLQALADAVSSVGAVATVGRILTAAAGTVTGLLRQAEKAVSASSGAAASAVRSTTTRLSGVTVPAATTDAIRSTLKDVLAATTPVAMMSSQIGKIVFASAGAVASAARSATKTVSTIVDAAASALKGSVKAIAGATEPIASADAIKAALVALGVATTPAASMARAVGKALRSIADAIAGATRMAALSMAATAGAIGDIAKVRASPQSVAATATPNAQIARSPNKIVAAEGAAAATVSKTLGKALAATAAPIAVLVRSTFLALSSLADAAASLVEAFHTGTPNTPASRTLAILGERRTLAVPGENRSLAVQGEDRTLRAS